MEGMGLCAQRRRLHDLNLPSGAKAASRADVRLLHRLFDDVGFILELTANVNVPEKQTRQTKSARSPQRAFTRQGVQCTSSTRAGCAECAVWHTAPHRTAVLNPPKATAIKMHGRKRVRSTCAHGDASDIGALDELLRLQCVK